VIPTPGPSPATPYELGGYVQSSKLLLLQAAAAWVAEGNSPPRNWTHDQTSPFLIEAEHAVMAVSARLGVTER
jgi:hypothetical protein